MFYSCGFVSVSRTLSHRYPTSNWSFADISSRKSYRAWLSYWEIIYLPRSEKWNSLERILCSVFRLEFTTATMIGRIVNNFVRKAEKLSPLFSCEWISPPSHNEVIKIVTFLLGQRRSFFWLLADRPSVAAQAERKRLSYRAKRNR